jgi:purine-binding chemotaxis protein CheW
MAEDRLLCTFRLAEHLFGIEIASVQEVLREQEITRLPLASPAVRGVINLRGRIVPAVDLRRCFEMEPAKGRGGSPNIVVRGLSSSSVSLLVDEIGEVVEVPASAYENPPETLRGRARELIQGVYKLQDELLLVLAIGKVLRAAYS